MFNPFKRIRCQCTFGNKTWRIDPKFIKGAPYKSIIGKIDHSTLDDPEKWAVTWRAYLNVSEFL